MVAKFKDYFENPSVESMTYYNGEKLVLFEIDFKNKTLTPMPECVQEQQEEPVPDSQARE